MWCPLCVELAATPDRHDWAWSRPSRCKRCGERQVRKSGHSYRCTRCRKHWHAVQYAKVSAT